MKAKRLLSAAATAAAMALPPLLTTAPAQAQQVTVAYQGIYNPWKVAIDKGTFERATGYEIEWRKFDSGGAVINALASGDVHIGVAGSSPIAAGVSRGLPLELFWILEDINSAEALVVHNDSGITAPRDLFGKRIGVPFASTTHFHLLFALEQFGVHPRRVRIINMQPNQIAASWPRQAIDAAFVWDPALSEIKKNGRVLITSGLLSSWGKATFDGITVQARWGASNKDFMAKFVRVLADADASYRDNPSAWGANSANARSIVKLVGGDTANVPGVLALYKFPDLDEQTSAAWLGGGDEGGAAKALRFTSEFLEKEKKVDRVQPSYGKFVNPSYAEAAKKL